MVDEMRWWEMRWLIVCLTISLPLLTSVSWFIISFSSIFLMIGSWGERKVKIKSYHLTTYHLISWSVYHLISYLRLKWGVGKLIAHSPVKWDIMMRWWLMVMVSEMVTEIVDGILWSSYNQSTISYQIDLLSSLGIILVRKRQTKMNYELSHHLIYHHQPSSSSHHFHRYGRSDWTTSSFKSMFTSHTKNRSWEKWYLTFYHLIFDLISPIFDHTIYNLPSHNLPCQIW